MTTNPSQIASLELTPATALPFARQLIETAASAEPIGAFARLVVAQEALVKFADPNTPTTEALHELLMTQFMDLSARDNKLHGLCMEKMLVSGIQTSAKARGLIDSFKAH